jgi:hypothetical protein
VDDVCSPPGIPGARDQPFDGRFLRYSRPGREEAGVSRAARVGGRRDHVGVLGVRDEQSVEGRDLGEHSSQCGVVQRRELRHAGVEQEALETDDAGVVQRAQMVEVARNGAAPERDVGRDLVSRCLPFHLQRLDRGGRRDRVEGHVDDRRDATGDGRPGGAGEAFPLGPAGLVDVHVAVHQTGKEHLVVGEGDRGLRSVVEGGDRGDAAVVAVHGSRPLAAGQDHAPGPDDQLHA